MNVVTAALDPEHPDAQALLALSDGYMAELYPAESNHMVPTRELGQPEFPFLGCWINDTVAGCGGVKFCRGAQPYGEIKRLFVHPEYRGQGASSALMTALESRALAAGMLFCRLEVGIHQPEALALYKGRGYREIAPFGDYHADPLSLFMEKQLP